MDCGEHIEAAPCSLHMTHSPLKHFITFWNNKLSQSHIVHFLSFFLFFSANLELIIPPRILFRILIFPGVGMVLRDLTLDAVGVHCYRTFQWSEAEKYILKNETILIFLIKIRLQIFYLFDFILVSIFILKMVVPYINIIAYLLYASKCKAVSK